MKKTITLSATLIAAALFAGSAAASDKQSEDILHGQGKVPTTASAMFVQFEAAPKETGDYLIWNLHQTEAVNRSDAYVQGRSDQDNRDNLRDRV
jgi:hypothetical protein